MAKKTSTKENENQSTQLPPRTWSMTSLRSSLSPLPFTKFPCRVIERYKKIIEYHLDQDNRSQIQSARKDILNIKKVMIEMEYFRKINLEKAEENEVLKEVLNKIKYFCRKIIF